MPNADAPSQVKRTPDFGRYRPLLAPPPRLLALPNERLVMIALRRLPPLPLLLPFTGLAALSAGLLAIRWALQAQAQEVPPTQAAAGANPPAKPTDLQASRVHNPVPLTWRASADQTVPHHAILRRNPATAAAQIFHVIEINVGPGTGCTDGSVSPSTTCIHRVKPVSPTGVSRWSGYATADTPGAPDPTATQTPAPTPEPEPTPVDLAPSDRTAAPVVPRFAAHGGPARGQVPPPPPTFWRRLAGGTWPP